MESDEKPLEIALDCSAKGLASPKFLFKSALPPSAPPLTPRRSSGYATSIMAGIEDYTLHLSQPEHYNSSTSLGSGLSLASSKSAKSKSNTSLTGKTSKKKVQKTLSNQETGQSPSLSAAAHTNALQKLPTPNSGRKISKSKAAVSNFITRSLRVRRKSKQSAPPAPNESPSQAVFHRQDSNEEGEEEEEEDDEEYSGLQLTNSLISPRIPVEKKFTLSTVMHVYFTEGKQAQVYKSVLVSEKATTVEVIAQALERYNMKCREPQEYTLFDVIGKWLDVTNSSQSHLNYLGQQNRTLPNLNILNASPLIQRRTSVEEFVVCYCRELGPDESPYNTQFYLTTQEGFTRRFELRSKSSPNPMSRGISHEKSHSVDIMERPDEVTPTPGDVGERKKPSEERDEFGIFGNTAHRKRARRNRIGNQSVDSADPDMEVTILNSQASPMLPREVGGVVDKEGGMRAARTSGNLGGAVREKRTGQDTQHADAEIPISLNKSHPPDFSALRSSPDSGVESNKQTNSTKSSVSSEQSEHCIASDPVALYPANLNCPFLLSLCLQDPSKEHLVHKLNSAATELWSWSNSSSRERPPAETANSSTERISLQCSDFEGSLCSLSRQPVAESPCTPEVPAFTLQRIHPDVHISVNGDSFVHSITLRHGDIITIGSNYFFMFVDYSSQPPGSAPRFDWKLLSQRDRVSVSTETITERDSRAARSLSDAEGEGSNVVGCVAGSSGEKRREGNDASSNHRHQKQSSKNGKIVESAASDHQGPVRNSSETSARQSAEKRGAQSTTKKSPQHKNTEKTKHHRHTNSKSHSPKDRKLVFSFRASEEDVLLGHVVSARATSNCLFKLAPAYILAMCTEYSLMANGPDQVLRFVQKATDHIQEIVWVSKFLCKPQHSSDMLSLTMSRLHMLSA